ncbi:M48 family metalloprotease [Streptomyces misionensis]|uniref:M48 family metalloprotease n=1 Tax=Streptomyces misionensis TaxID=67331 RepID=A0A5C6J879_9ACTN|nr:M48 family metalloprotease [Streptomyces misionensis]TWV36717.1 M48 family metalloprotease [Streptomyces misionensis]
MPGAARGPGHRPAVVLTAYAGLWPRLTEAVGRRQEYAADRVAARIAGRDSTVDALRRVPALKAADDLCLGAFALMGEEAGLLPPAGRYHGGLALLLADGTRRTRWDALSGDTGQRGRRTTHPPTADRIAAPAALHETAPPPAADGHRTAARRAHRLSGP